MWFFHIHRNISQDAKTGRHTGSQEKHFVFLTVSTFPAGGVFYPGRKVIRAGDKGDLSYRGHGILFCLHAQSSRGKWRAEGRAPAGARGPI